jgi:hypothetical protein
MGAVVSWLKASWLALIVGAILGRFLLTRVV